MAEFGWVFRLSLETEVRSLVEECMVAHKNDTSFEQMGVEKPSCIAIHFGPSDTAVRFTLGSREKRLDLPAEYVDDRRLFGALLRQLYPHPFRVEDFIVYDSGPWSGRTETAMLCGWDIYFE
jgi:hypothetical protein